MGITEEFHITVGIEHVVGEDVPVPKAIGGTADGELKAFLALAQLLEGRVAFGQDDGRDHAQGGADCQADLEGQCIDSRGKFGKKDPGDNAG